MEKSTYVQASDLADTLLVLAKSDMLVVHLRLEGTSTAVPVPITSISLVILEPVGVPIVVNAELSSELVGYLHGLANGTTG